MTGREKIASAFSIEGAPEIAAVVPYEDLYIRDNWARLTSLPWWRRADPSIERQLEWRRDVRKYMRHDWFPVPGFRSADERKTLRIDPRDDGVFLVDTRTGREKRMEPPRIGGWGSSGEVASFRPANPPAAREDIDRLIPVSPRVEARDIQWHGSDDLAKAILAGYGGDLYPISQVSSPLWSCYGLWGFEGMMTMIVENPDLVGYACKRFLLNVAQQVQAAASLGAEAIWIEECLIDHISPESYRRLNVPVLSDLVAEIRATGLKSIYYFCGNPAGKWDYILSMGADALALEEGKKGFTIDIAEVVELVRGRCALLGNLDAIGVLQNGTEDQLRAEIVRQIAAGRKNGSRFIMSVGSPGTPGTTPDRFRLYCDLAHELGAL